MKNGMLLKALSASIMLLLVISCAGLLGPSPEDDRKAITVLLIDHYLKGWNEGDADMIANTFAKDATFQSKLRGLIKGRENIRNYIDVVLGYLAGAIVTMEIKNIELTGEDTAKAFVDIATGKKKVSKVLLLKRVNKEWFISHY
jgi:uncharacterized protein (TIGR02246 family)